MWTAVECHRMEHNVCTTFCIKWISYLFVWTCWISSINVLNRLYLVASLNQKRFSDRNISETFADTFFSLIQNLLTKLTFTNTQPFDHDHLCRYERVIKLHTQNMFPSILTALRWPPYDWNLFSKTLSIHYETLLSATRTVLLRFKWPTDHW